MRLGDLVGKSKRPNKSNGQSSWHPKKRVLKKEGITEEELLNIDISKIL